MNAKEIMNSAADALCAQMRDVSKAHKRGEITKDEANKAIKALMLAVAAVSA